MPSRVPYPPDMNAQFCWNAQSPYGNGPMAVSSTETEPLDWPFYPSATVQCPDPSVYQPFLDTARPAMDTPSLDGSTKDSPCDCPSAEGTTLNTPTSTCPYNFDVQDTDSLEIMLSGSPQAQMHYAHDLPGTRLTDGYPQYQNRTYLKRLRRESEIHPAGLDIRFPEKMPRVSRIPQTRFEASPDPDLDYPDGNGVETPIGDETDGEGGANSEPYAQLIYRALKSAPNHSMVLKDIYEWFEQNTDKAKIAPTSSAKGWQNSIRHNLSMNGAFNKVEQIPPSDDSKKGFIWVLADSALQEGVKSTTRYRKHNSNKKGARSDHPAPQRQLSGAKGGKAAKKSAANASRMAASKLRRSVRSSKLASSIPEEPQTSSLHVPAREEYEESPLHYPHDLPYQPGNSPYYHHTPTSTPLSLISEPRALGYTNIVGCTPEVEGPLFYDDPNHIDGPMLSSHDFTDIEENLLECHFDGPSIH